MKPSLDELSRRDLAEMAEGCARAAHVTLEEMFSEDRTFPPARARRAFYARLRAEGWSQCAIARLVGRHHTTVAYQLVTFDAEEARVRVLGRPC